MIATSRRLFGLFLALAVACGGSEPVAPPVTPSPKPPTPPVIPAPTFTPVTMTVLGRGDFKPTRYTAELAVRGTTAYTTTWGNSTAAASVFYIWDVSGAAPKVVDSVRVDGATTLGDAAISDDGGVLMIATERSGGGIVLYDITTPRVPKLITRWITAETTAGVHTAKFGRVNGRRYGFLSIDPATGVASKLVIVDLTDPASPQRVFSQFVGSPYVHDVFVRDGLLYLALWNDGVAIWDIGGGGAGGTVQVPVELGRVRTTNGEVHNIWWLKDPGTGITRYAFIGEEGPGSIGASSIGDIHVVDVSDRSAPREVAFYSVPGAGTHNFSVDEVSGYLYAAYYNAGVRALDVRGDLSTCTSAERSAPAGTTSTFCDLRKMGRERGVGLLDRGTAVYVWGVQYIDGAVYASDMINGLWKLVPVSRF